MAEHDDWPVPPDLPSDGCTLPWWAKILVGWAFKRHREACRRHDWARRHLVHYGIVTVQEADAKLYQDWTRSGMWRWFARLAWNFVKFTRGRYSRTLPIPADKPHWHDYAGMARAMMLEKT